MTGSFVSYRKEVQKFIETKVLIQILTKVKPNNRFLRSKESYKTYSQERSLSQWLLLQMGTVLFASVPMIDHDTFMILIREDSIEALDIKTLTMIQCPALISTILVNHLPSLTYDIDYII